MTKAGRRCPRTLHVLVQPPCPWTLLLPCDKSAKVTGVLTMKRALFGLIGAILLAGCAAPGQRSETTPAARASGASANPVFATQLAGPSTFLAPMPTAVAVLKPDNLNRNRAFCSAVTSHLPTAQQAMSGSVVAPNLVLTRWLVQLQDVPADRTTDCDFLVGVYDYARAARLLGALRLTDGRLSGQGPFLLMAVPDSTGLHVVGLDGSAYSDADLGRFVDTWSTALIQTQTQVTQAPDQPGLVRSLAYLVSAIFRTVAGATGGLIQGVITNL